MKYKLPIVLALLISTVSFAQVNTPPNTMVPTPSENVQHPEYIQYKEKKFDFGFIKKDVPVSHVFEFKNVGDRDIELISVNVSCGCTTPNWKGGKYKPQETAYITATFNAHSEGFFNKVVTVLTSEGLESLVITGNVLNNGAYAEYAAKKHVEDSIKMIEQKKLEKKLKKERKKAEKAAKKEKKRQEKEKKKQNSEATEKKDKK